MRQQVRLLNVDVDNITMDELVDSFRQGLLLTLHVDMIMKLQKDREFYEHLQGFWIPVSQQNSRYVRLYSRGNTSDPQNQYIEIEVWGK